MKIFLLAVFDFEFNVLIGKYKDIDLFTRCRLQILLRLRNYGGYVVITQKNVSSRTTDPKKGFPLFVEFASDTGYY